MANLEISHKINKRKKSKAKFEDLTKKSKNQMKKKL